MAISDARRAAADGPATGSLNARLSRLISRARGSSFTIDERIGAGYLLGVVVERALMKLRGLVRFPTADAHPFIGRGVRIKARHRLDLAAGVTLGHGCYIDALSVDGVRLGRNTSVGRNTRIEATGSLRTLGQGMVVGDNVGLGTDNLYGCAGGITIGEDTIVGNYVSFHSENHVIDDLDVPIRDQGVTHLGISVGADCWIGAKTTILDGAHIGDHCVIAAGSVVIAGEYPDYGIYGGVPARRLKTRE